MKLCLKCQLNWIKDSDEYCRICKAELGLEGGFSLCMDEEEKLCPICEENLIDSDEEACDECLKKLKKIKLKTSDDIQQDEETNDIENDNDDINDSEYNADLEADEEVEDELFLEDETN